MCASWSNGHVTIDSFRSTKEAMTAMFDWVWLPVGALATPTLTRNLKPIIFMGQARRGGLQASGVTFGQRAVGRRDLEREEEEEEELHVEGESDNSLDDGLFITWEEQE